jgi:hypothetical protein
MELQISGTQRCAKVFGITENPVQIPVHANELDDTCTCELRLRSVLSHVKMKCIFKVRHSFTTNKQTFNFDCLFACF